MTQESEKQATGRLSADKGFSDETLDAVAGGGARQGSVQSARKDRSIVAFEHASDSTSDVGVEELTIVHEAIYREA